MAGIDFSAGAPYSTRMIETLKHTLYAGIGAAVLTAEKVEASLQELVDKGKISAEEARQAADRIATESKKEFKDARSSLEKAFEEMLGKAPIASKKEVEALKARIDALEKTLAELTASDS